MLVRSQPSHRLFSLLRHYGRYPRIQTTRQLSNLLSSKYIDYSAPEFSLPEDTKIASVALVGAPNAGKSSLSNALIRNRVSAVSRKVNTTRGRIAGACTHDKRQLIFWDTPGIVERQFVRSLGEERRELTTAGWGAAADADIAVMVVDVSRGEGYWRRCAKISSELASVRQNVQQDSEIQEEEDHSDRKPGLLLVLNKSDITRPKTRLLVAAEFFQEHIEGFQPHFDQHIFMVSAYNGRGVDDLREALLERTKMGNFEVPDGTTHCDDDLELVRQHIWEKLLHCVHQEVPYRCKFENEALFEMPNGELYVSEVIHVPHSRTVSIVVGPRGSLIQWIREKTMESASIALGKQVNLKLRVAVK